MSEACLKCDGVGVWIDGHALKDVNWKDKKSVQRATDWCECVLGQRLRFVDKLLNKRMLEEKQRQEKQKRPS